MRRHYVIAWEPYGEWAIEHVRRDGITVFEPEHEPLRTGLLDKNGVEIMRVDIPNPIGFLAEIED